MRLLSQVVVGCSYAIAIVLAVAWLIVAFGDIDLRARLIMAVSGAGICGIGIGILSLLLGRNRRDPNQAPGHTSHLDDPVRR
jgi:hypothetical protein